MRWLWSAAIVAICGGLAWGGFTDRLPGYAAGLGWVFVAIYFLLAEAMRASSAEWRRLAWDALAIAGGR